LRGVGSIAARLGIGGNMDLTENERLAREMVRQEQPPAWALRVAQEIEDTCALPESYAHEIAAIIARECPVGELAGAAREVLRHDTYAARSNMGLMDKLGNALDGLRAALDKLA
jgi:hypothetical protein